MVSGKKSLRSRFLDTVGEPVQTDVSLCDFSHFKIGGAADFFYEATTEAGLRAALEFAREEGLPFYLIGGGYNLLFADEGYRGLIIKNSVAGVSSRKETILEVEAGTALARLEEFCVEFGWTGLEFMTGIPGTVGGAVFGNAGAFEQTIGQHLIEATLLGAGKKTVEVGRDELAFGYRSSRLKKKHDVLLKAAFCVKQTERTKVEELLSDYSERRGKNHPPWETACAGSYFKNPVVPDGTRIPAARLLDKAGAKGLSLGGASIYENHANFIINRGQATSQNVRDLAAELKRRVRDESGIELEEEVIFVPEFATLP